MTNRERFVTNQGLLLTNWWWWRRTWFRLTFTCQELVLSRAEKLGSIWLIFV